MTRSCLKLRCPTCKGRTRLAAEKFDELRRRPTVPVEHQCEHCGRRFPATLLSGLTGDADHTPSRPPSADPTPVERRPEPMIAPFAPRAAAPVIDGAPPFGPLGERQDAPRGRKDAPIEAPPFAPGQAVQAPASGKKSLNEWWKSQSPKRQWTFIACFGVMIGSFVLSTPTEEASASGNEPAVETTEPKPETATPAKEKEPAASKPTTTPAAGTSFDDAMGLLCEETPALGGRIEKPLAAAFALDGKGYVVRAAKAFGDLQNSGGSTSRWFVAAGTKRYKVTQVRFHPEFPVEKLKAAIAKGASGEVADLLRGAERFDVALLETAETPAASMTLARDPTSISGKPLEIATPVDPKPAKGGQSVTVKYARNALTPEMLKDDGAGLAVPLAAGCDATVVTKEGLLAAFVPRKNAPGAAVHPIVAAETLAELLGGK
jgi:hypothetical protein